MVLRAGFKMWQCGSLQSKGAWCSRAVCNKEEWGLPALFMYSAVIRGLVPTGIHGTAYTGDALPVELTAEKMKEVLWSTH